MSEYYFVNFIETENGKIAAFPNRNADYLMLADSKNSKFALYETEFIDPVNYGINVKKIPDELKILIDSSKRYPPALAFSKNSIEKTIPRDESEFSELFKGFLIKNMKECFDAEISFVQVIQSDDFDLEVGEFVWVIRKDDNPDVVKYISWDYYIYESDAKNFDFRE